MKKLIKMVAIAAMFAMAGCGQVGSDEAGLFTRWGEIISQKPISDGMHIYNPIGTDLITYSTRNKTLEVRTPAFTKDLQAMDEVYVAVTYHIDRDMVIDLHKNTGKDYENILIVPSVLGATKDMLGKLVADEIVASREKATEFIFKALSDRLKPHGIVVSLVNIMNIDYSDAFEKAVEEKQVALQKSIKEKNETARLREVAEQEVVKAEAEAKAKVLNSEAEAKAILVKSEAEAKSIEMRNKALAQSRALIEYETVKTWDGKLPVQMLGGAPLPFINLEGGQR